MNLARAGAGGLDVYASWRRPAGARPFVFGHRGARHAAPENTLGAFELARDEGADGVELDVRLDRTGDVVVAHDATLSRVTEERDSRRVDQLSRSQLDLVDVGGGEPIPRLRSALDFCRAHGLRVNVELKSDLNPPGTDSPWRDKLRGVLSAQHVALVRGCAREAQRIPDAGRMILFSSFNPLLVVALRRIVPQIPAAWLVHDQQDLALGLARRRMPRELLGLRAVHPQRTLATAGNISAWHSNDALVNVWTVNEPQEAVALAARGIDGLISDYPGRLLSALGG